MQPFLLVATRPEDETARQEYDSFVRFTKLDPEQLIWVRADREDIPDLGSGSFSGVILAGSPFNTTDDQDSKSRLQIEVEAKLAAMLDSVIALDLPFFGACYGVSTLGVHQGALVNREHGEKVGVIPITVTDAGREDPVIQHANLPEVFRGIVGHKEAIATLPPHATVLATGEVAPVQMFRIGTRQYATQFHPELDIPLVVERLTAYQNHGYFEPGTFTATVERLRASQMDPTGRLLEAFVAVHGRRED